MCLLCFVPSFASLFFGFNIVPYPAQPLSTGSSAVRVMVHISIIWHTFVHAPMLSFSNKVVFLGGCVPHSFQLCMSGVSVLGLCVVFS